jgi:hypothetical protein
MPELTGALLVVAVVAAVVGLMINAGFLLWAAGIVGIEQRTFGKAIGVTLLGGIASAVVSFFIAGLPVINFVIGFVVYALVAMPLFATTFGKAIGATFVSWVLSIVVVGGGLLLLALATGTSLAGLL